MSSPIITTKMYTVQCKVHEYRRRPVPITSLSEMLTQLKFPYAYSSNTIVIYLRRRETLSSFISDKF